MPGSEVSTINSIGFSLTLILGILLISLPRRFAYLPMLISVGYISLGQGVVLGGLHFNIMRILIFIGYARLIFRREIPHIKRNSLDNAIIYWLICGFLAYTLREQTLGAIINRLGFFYDGFGLYFFFRFVIWDPIETEKIIKALVIISIPLAIALVIENMTGRNLFSIFGGVAEYAWVRDEKFRSQGPFRHAILAGTFGAVAMPLFISLWYSEPRRKVVAIIGVAVATLIVWSSTSSGPLLSYVFGIIGMVMWRFRDKMRIVRWGILLVLIFIHAIMKAPVWYLMSRISDIIGGTGWHRSYLIDQAIVHFEEWWFLGTSYTAHWMPYGLERYPNQTDITNNFIQQGVNGGILNVVLFVVVIIVCFRTVGIAIRRMEDQPIGIRMTVWSMGVSLLVHVVSFMSVTYFDQMIVVWYLLLAMISNLCSKIVNKYPAPSED